MRGKYTTVENFLDANKLTLLKDCKALGSLDPGGLSNYWGLQIDNFFKNDQRNFNKKELISLKENFLEFIKKYNLLGSLDKVNNNFLYSNDYKIPNHLNKILNKNNSKFQCKKPILAFSKKNFSGNLNSINEKKDKLNAHNFFKKVKKKKNNFSQMLCRRNKKKQKKYRDHM